MRVTVEIDLNTLSDDDIREAYEMRELTSDAEELARKELKAEHREQLDDILEEVIAVQREIVRFRDYGEAARLLDRLASWLGKEASDKRRAA